MTLKLNNIKYNNRKYKGLFNNMVFEGDLTSDNKPKGTCSYYDHSGNLLFSAVMSDTSDKVTNIEELKGTATASTNYSEYDLTYSGDIHEDKPHGVGKLTYTKGTKTFTFYEGKFLNGLFDGNGSYSDKNYLYEGTFRKGKMNGEGKITYKKSKISYSGNFKNDKIEGKGHIVYADGTYYKGDFKDNEFHGNGEKKIKYGDKTFIFTGLFVNNEIAGLGLLKNDELEIYGNWDGKKISKGTIYYKNENMKYEGSISNSRLTFKRNGKGILNYNHQGVSVCIMHGKFEDDKLIEGTITLKINDISNKSKKFEYEVFYSGTFDDECCLHGSKCSIIFRDIRNNKKLNSYSGNFEHGKIVDGELVSDQGKFKGKFNEDYPILKKFNLVWCKKVQDYGMIYNNDIDVLKYGHFSTKKINYIGSYKNNMYEGEGSLLNLKDNSFYSGNFKESKKDGFGTYKISNYVFEGNFKNDMYNGNGKETLVGIVNNEVYEGNFKDNKRSGNGILKFTDNNDMYEGNFLDGEISGKGLYKFSNGDYYEGEFKNSLRNNFGTYFYKDENLKVSGNWLNNKEHGEMRLQYGNSSIELKYFNHGNEVSKNEINKVNQKRKRKDSGKSKTKLQRSFSAGKVNAANTLLSMDGSR